MLTQNEVKKLFTYNRDTGELIRRISIGTGGFGCKQGNSVGSKSTSGYIRVRVNGKYYPRSHLVWLYHKGYLPTKVIDHIDRVRTNDKIDNLREVVYKDNYKNLSKRTNNKSGVTGVAWHKKAKKWRAYIMIDSTHIHLGLFKNKEDAKTARKEADKKYGFSPTHGTSTNNISLGVTT